MNQYEIPAIIEDELPVVSNELGKIKKFGDAIQIMQALVRFMRKMVSVHNLPVVIKCMHVVDNIYSRGDRIVKNAIENVFVLSFTNLQTGCSLKEWNTIRRKIPITLYSLYINRLYGSGMSAT